MKTAIKTIEESRNLHFYWQRFKGHCQEMKTLWREQGFKAIIARYGWKFFAVVFCYYLVRDVTLYILIPYWIAEWSTR